MNRILFFTLLALLPLASACGGCTGNNVTTAIANVTIDEVDPPAGYPGVTMTVSFTIEPDKGTTENGMEWEVNFGDGTRTTGEGVEGEASHGYEIAGQYDIEVSAIFDDEVVGTDVVPIRIYSPVDLLIDGTRGTPANSEVGDDLQISFTVTNNTAAEVFTAFEVSAFLSDSPDVTVDDVDDLISLGSTEVTPDVEGEPVLESGGDRSAAFSSTIPEDLTGGDYYVVTQLDPRGRIADTDPSNNFHVSNAIVRIENPAEALPDPCVRDLFVSPDRAFPQLNTITRGVVVCNRGGQDAFDVVLKTYLSEGDAELDDGDLLLNTTDSFDVFANDTSDVGPNQLVLSTDDVITPTGADVEVWVIVVVESTDPNAQDADPTNNMAIMENPIIVTDEPVQGPDIVVRDFSVSPDSTFLNGTLDIAAEIANEGTIDVGSFFCGIYLGDGPSIDTMNDPRLSNINVPSLPAGETTTVEQSITVPGLYDPGVYNFYMVCDPLNALQEPFRSNNAFIYGTPITITDEADVDLFVETLTVPSDVNEGDMFDIVARYCVQGSNPSGETIARLYRNTGTQVDFTADHFLEVTVPSVLPGGENCQEVTYTVEASCSEFQDTYVFGIETDVDGRLPELNESNNRATGSNPVSISGTYCQCIEDGFEPNDSVLEAVPLLEGTTSAAICTSGNEDYWAVDLAAGDSLIARTTFDSTLGGLKTSLQLEGAGSSLLAEDDSPDEQEVAIFNVDQDRRYVVQVSPTTSDLNLYDLDINILSPVNGIDLFARNVRIPANDVSIGETIDVTVTGYNIGDSDTGSFQTEVYISPDPIPDDGNNTLVGSRMVTNIAASSSDDITVSATIPTTVPDGDYWLIVVLDPQGATGDVDPSNNTAVSARFPVTTECYDALEPNNGFGNDAREVTANTFSNLTACAVSDDYYKLCLTTGKRFDVTVNFDDSNGDIDLRLFNDQNVLIDSSANAGVDVEQVSWDFVNGDQCFYIKTELVTLDQSLETTYSMTVNVEDVDPALLCDSLFEPNDSFATSSSLIAAVDQTFSLDRCPAADTDFYHVNLAGGENYSFTASKNPANQAGTLRLQLYTANMSPGPNKETGPGVPSATLDYTAPQDGLYYVQVTVSGAARNITYDLSVTGLTGVDLAPTNLIIGPGDYQVNDEVRFAFDLQNLRTDAVTSPEYEVFFSTSATLDAANDTSLGTFTSPDVGGNSTVGVNNRANVPPTAPAGQGYLHILVDPAGTTADLDPTNNVTSVPISIVP